MKVLVIRHAPFEGLGKIAAWLQKVNADVTEIRTYEDMAIPTSSQGQFLIVMGGPMSVNDPLPFLAAERQLIKSHVLAGGAMLGICLGGQQLAHAFGGQVAPAVKEVGWSAVTDLSSGKEHQVLHWHGEGFSLPPAGELLYTSKDWAFQGFRLKNAVGLQFHPEVDASLVAAFVENDQEFIAGSVLAQTPREILATPIPTENTSWLFRLLDELSAASSSHEK